VESNEGRTKTVKKFSELESVQSKILSKRVNDIGQKMSGSWRKEWISGSRRTQETNNQGQSEIVRKRKERPGGLPGHTYPAWNPGEGGGAGELAEEGHHGGQIFIKNINKYKYNKETVKEIVEGFEFGRLGHGGRGGGQSWSCGGGNIWLLPSKEDKTVRSRTSS
jgi:hypothetical protein